MGLTMSVNMRWSKISLPSSQAGDSAIWRDVRNPVLLELGDLRAAMTAPAKPYDQPRP